MLKPPLVKILSILAWLVGIALLLALIIDQGFNEILGALAQVSWGMLPICLFFAVPLWMDTVAWQLLIKPEIRPSLGTLIAPRWICTSVNALMPVAQVGGEIVRGRLLIQAGVRAAISGASVVADVTVGILSQVVFIVFGVAILLQLDQSGDISHYALIGLLIFTLVVAGFFYAQRSGLFGSVIKVVQNSLNLDKFGRLLDRAENLDAAIKATYARKKSLLQSFLWRLAAWFAGAGEIWLALYFLGHPISIAEAIMLESIGQAIRSSAFMIPGGLGVQEGGYMLLGVSLGLPAEIGLTLSLVKRLRELLLGIPALLYWRSMELGHARRSL